MSIGNRRIEEIEDIADGVLQDAFNIEPFLAPPVNIEKVSEVLGLTIKTANFKNNDIAGVFDRELKTIFVSFTDPIVRQRFTIAHEIGHYILHDHNINEEVYFRKDISWPHDNVEKVMSEQEANWFAASLLMPREAIKLYWKDLRDISDLADQFRVSISVVRYRLENLGLVN